MRTPIFCVANNKGGVGKTSIAAHLAFYLAEKMDKRVLCIDLDAQCNFSSVFMSRDDAMRLTGSSSLFSDPSAVKPFATGDKNIMLIPSSRGLKGVDQLNFTELFIANDRIRDISKDFDAVVIDTPPHLGLPTQTAMVAATSLVCPLIPEMFSVDGLSTFVAESNTIRSRFNPGLSSPIFVINMVKDRAAQHREVIAHIESNYSAAKPHLPHNIAVADALADNRPLWRRSSNKTIGYNAIAAKKWLLLCDEIATRGISK